jgi:hypothetical protein
MGDYSGFSTSNNPRCPHRSSREEPSVLEWKPRLIAVLLVLIAIAIATGFVDFGVVDNWEW